mmetsp:Transcript_15098/g.44863  ORF Transcript_15098/g.44863 Transcript_15098/m.44863 type:complete len:341 (+) Transcript_15098:911-1933(+)
MADSLVDLDAHKSGPQETLPGIQLGELGWVRHRQFVEPADFSQRLFQLDHRQVYLEVQSDRKGAAGLVGSRLSVTQNRGRRGRRGLQSAWSVRRSSSDFSGFGFLAVVRLSSLVVVEILLKQPLIIHLVRGAPLLGLRLWWWRSCRCRCHLAIIGRSCSSTVSICGGGFTIGPLGRRSVHVTEGDLGRMPFHECRFDFAQDRNQSVALLRCQRKGQLDSIQSIALQKGHDDVAPPPHRPPTVLAKALVRATKILLSEPQIAFVCKKDSLGLGHGCLEFELMVFGRHLIFLVVDFLVRSPALGFTSGISVTGVTFGVGGRSSRHGHRSGIFALGPLRKRLD